MNQELDYFVELVKLLDWMIDHQGINDDEMDHFDKVRQVTFEMLKNRVNIDWELRYGE